MPDVNVLVYAHRQDEVTHQAYRAWLEDLVRGPEPFGLSLLVAVGFVRIATNPRIFSQPTPLDVALATIDNLLACPSCRPLRPGKQHWSLVGRLCSHADATGKLVADAQHAAVAIEHGCELVSRDSDFLRFRTAGLRCQVLELS